MGNGKITLGKLESVDPRQVWASEASDFTPWLAKEDNLKLLGDTIGIELEFEAQEKSVGPFRADILCKDTINGHWVLIENQLAKTDHTHLGQLLTYAAGLKAVTIVWIADKFTDEHRAALDWLNEITDDSFNFFGLEVEVWKIGDSLAAPKFNMAAKPNDWIKTIGGAAHRIESGELSETKQLQLEYWTELQKLLVDRKSPFKSQKPSPQHWSTFAVGRANFHINALVNTRDKRIGCQLVIYGSDKTAYFHLLEDEKEAIESQVGSELDWDELPGKKEGHVNLMLEDTDPTQRGQWSKQHDWLANTLEKFHETFSQRVKQLDAAEYEPEDEEAETVAS